MSGITIVEFGDPRWADFVARQPGATPFHHPEWARLVANCYGFGGFAVAVSDTAGKIQAGLPVVEVCHFGGARKWVSLPFTDYCGPLVPDPALEADLVAGLRLASREAGVRRVEIRGLLAGAAPLGGAAFRHVVALSGCPQEVYARFCRTARQQIRQAENNGVRVRQATRREDLTGTFYRLHARTRRRLGVPVQPRRFFGMLWDSVMPAPDWGWC